MQFLGPAFQDQWWILDLFAIFCMLQLMVGFRVFIVDNKIDALF